MAAPLPSDFDANQVLQHAFIESTGELRVNATISPSGGATEVIISHEDDSIRLGDGTNLVSVSSFGSKYGLDVNIINDGIAGVPHVAALNLTLSGTEYSFTIPLNTKKLQIKSRLNGKIKYSFNSGDIISGVYMSIAMGAYRDINNIDTSLGLSLYATSSKAGDTLEITYWT